MKKQMLLITLVSLVMGIGKVTAQKGITFQINYSSDYSPRSYAKKDIREYHAFQKDVIDFSKAVNRNKIRRARSIKNDLLKRMRNEIKDTQQKIRFTKRELDYPFGNDLHKKGRKTNEYSKRNSNRNNDELRYLRALEKQFTAQKRILNRLEYINLEGGKKFSQQARQHEILIQDFEATLKADINFSFKEYRNRNRRN